MSKSIKNSIFSFILIGTFQFVWGVEESGFSYLHKIFADEYQGDILSLRPIKERVTFPCGTTFAQFEAYFRQKYSHLDLLPIDIADCDGIQMNPKSEEKSRALDDYCINNPEDIQQAGLKDFGPVTTERHDYWDRIDLYSDPIIKVAPDFCKEGSPEQAEWALLHENGHGTMPGNSSIVASGVFPVVASYVGAFWGIHKKKPYRNCITRCVGKTAAMVTLPIVACCAAMRLEERRADNFANKHADKKALLGGIESFERYKKVRDDMVSKVQNTDQSDFSKLIRTAFIRNIPEFLNDPIHPHFEGRIEKIKATLRARYDISL